MRRLLPSLLFGCLALAVSAEDVLGPADYLAILTESKLRYNMVLEPAKKPPEETLCPRRDASMRVVQQGKEKTLEAWTVKPEASSLFDEAETFYQAEKYDQAAAKYRQAIEADPEAAAAYFCYGDTFLFGAKDPAGALVQYQKGIALDPTLPLGYFFSSTAYVHLGKRAEAREAIIKALTLDPGYESIWKVAAANPAFWKIKPVVRHPFDPPAGYLGAAGTNGIDVFGGKNGEWLGYATCKAAWENESRFAKRRSDNGWSLDEERACVLNQVMATFNSTEAKLEEEEKRRGVAKPHIQESAILAAMPPLERHIFEAAQSHLLDGYVLFEIIGQKCRIAMSIMDDASRQQIEGYIRKYIILPSE